MKLVDVSIATLKTLREIESKSKKHDTFIVKMPTCVYKALLKEYPGYLYENTETETDIDDDTILFIIMSKKMEPII